MAKKEKPRSGSMAFYPRVRAKHALPRFSSMPRVEDEEARVLNFVGYKAGMGYVLGTNQHKGSPAHGMRVRLPVTVLECPPLKVFGYRVYVRGPYGLRAHSEARADALDPALTRALLLGASKTKKTGKRGKKSGGRGKAAQKQALLQPPQDLACVRLLAHTQPARTTLGRKKPEVLELFLSGSPENQLAKARALLGKEIRVSEVFEVNGFVDVKAVTRGHGMAGVVKRFNVKMQRPKAKKRRVVGSIGPWNPATVMFTVARPGQMGYHTRTEYNKHVLKIGEKLERPGGFTGYGEVRNEYLLVKGSVPGPVKRAVALRRHLRALPKESLHVEEVDTVVV